VRVADTLRQLLNAIAERVASALVLLGVALSVREGVLDLIELR